MKLLFTEANSQLLKCLIALAESKVQAAHEVMPPNLVRFGRNIALIDSDTIYGGNTICRYLGYSNPKSKLAMNLEIDSWLEFEENILSTAIAVYIQYDNYYIKI